MSASEPLPRPPAGRRRRNEVRTFGCVCRGKRGDADAGAGVRAGPYGGGPITLEVVCEGLIAIVRELRATIIRPSFSSVIYEFDDFSCAVFGRARDGRAVVRPPGARVPRGASIALTRP